MLAGNTGFVADLCDAIEAHGANAVAVYTYSLRPGVDSAGSPAVDLLAERQVDCVITTTLAAGAFDEEAEGWDPGALGALGVPVLQAVCATSSSEAWASSSAGLSPIDVAMAVAIPEFDGRIIGPPLSFKETVDDGDVVLGAPVTAYRTDPRSGRPGWRTWPCAWPACGTAAPEQAGWRVVLSAYPTSRSRLGNAVGLDTPASAVALLHALGAGGYRVDRHPGRRRHLMAELAERSPTTARP